MRSLYREDRLSQPQIALLLGRHKSWVCRRLALAESLSDELSASVRLGLVAATAAVELARLQRCNQDAVMQVVMRARADARGRPRGWCRVCWRRRRSSGRSCSSRHRDADAGTETPKGGSAARTPGEQLVADAWAMKRLAARLHARLLERSLASLGDAGVRTVSLSELVELRATLVRPDHHARRTPGRARSGRMARLDETAHLRRARARTARA